MDIKGFFVFDNVGERIQKIAKLYFEISTITISVIGAFIALYFWISEYQPLISIAVIMVTIVAIIAKYVIALLLCGVGEFVETTKIARNKMLRKNDNKVNNKSSKTNKKIKVNVKTPYNEDETEETDDEDLNFDKADKDFEDNSDDFKFDKPDKDFESSEGYIKFD